MKNKITNIPRPSSGEVLKYLKEWENSNYSIQENSLQKLFQETYKRNDDINNILIKVCALDALYSTNILDPYTVSKHIAKLKIDKELSHGDLSIVHKIATTKMNNGRTINFYSFATKYCSHHKPEVYPIYDSFVEKMLLHFRDNDFYFQNQDLRNFEHYKKIIEDFKKYYQLDFSLKEIDRYLWLAGKVYFPRQYRNKTKKRK